jgi:uncharacterized BrkB/YihY/UPF0761 family membrane protein
MLPPIDQTYTITGWVLGIVMVLLMGLGVFLSVKTHSKPMDSQDDLKWRKIRIAKWILTLLVFVALALHYLLSGWLM